MGTTARSAIRTAMGQETQNIISGTATATATTTTLIDTTRLKQRDDYFNGWQLLKTGGTGSGEIGDVSDFVQSTSTATLAQTQTASDNTTTYELYRTPFKIVDYNAAITAALDEAYAKGFARRGWDETLYTTWQRYYSLPSTLEDVSEVHMQAEGNRAYDPDWIGSGAGWTVHANATFGNNGDNQERTLDHLSTGANHYSTADIGITPGVEYAFRVRAISVLSTPTAVAQYQFRTSAGALIGSATNFGTYASATSGLISGTFIAPSNAAMVRIGLGSSSASGTVRFYEHNLRERGLWTAVPRGEWDIEWEGNTGRLYFRDRIPRFRVLLLKGRRALETMTADTDTLSFDAPELRAFIYLACATLWQQSMGATPAVDEMQSAREEARFRARFADVAGGLFDNFQLHSSIATPIWG